MPPKLLLLIISFLYLHGNGQQDSNIISFKKIGFPQGLSSYNVRKIIQDQYGYMWIATQDGLNRYDGSKIDIFSNNTSFQSMQILGNDITDIVEDRERNIIWTITSYGGLTGINTQTGNVEYKVSSYGNPLKFKNDWLKCINICKGRIWIGTYD